MSEAGRLLPHILLARGRRVPRASTRDARVTPSHGCDARSAAAVWRALHATAACACEERRDEQATRLRHTALAKRGRTHRASGAARRTYPVRGPDRRCVRCRPVLALGSVTETCFDASRPGATAPPRAQRGFTHTQCSGAATHGGRHRPTRGVGRGANHSAFESPTTAAAGVAPRAIRAPVGNRQEACTPLATFSVPRIHVQPAHLTALPPCRHRRCSRDARAVSAYRPCGLRAQGARRAWPRTGNADASAGVLCERERPAVTHETVLQRARPSA